MRVTRKGLIRTNLDRRRDVTRINRNTSYETLSDGRDAVWSETTRNRNVIHAYQCTMYHGPKCVLDRGTETVMMQSRSACPVLRDMIQMNLLPVRADHCDPSYWATGITKGSELLHLVACTTKRVVAGCNLSSEITRSRTWTIIIFKETANCNSGLTPLNVLRYNCS